MPGGRKCAAGFALQKKTWLRPGFSCVSSKRLLDKCAGWHSSLLPNDWTTKGIYSDLASLTIWAVEARYPGEWEEATVAEADAALRQAEAIFAAVSDDLKHRGLDS